MADPLSTAVSGLLAVQRSLATTGHNISNVNTEGYSRQRVENSTRTPEFTGAGYIGTGVKTDTIQRSFNNFIYEQVVSASSSFNQEDSFVALINQIDNMLADPNTGLSASLGRFFGAAQDLADDPKSIPARQALISEGDALVHNFKIFDQRFDDLNTTVNNTIEATVEDINSLALDIASINKQITETRGSINDQPPNDLLDKRNLLIKQLAELVSVDTFEQDDGAINVFIGKGQSLVVGINSQQLFTTLDPLDPSRLDVGIKLGSTGRVNVISDFLNGGSLGGVLSFRDNVLDDVISEVGRIALGLATDFNTQHRLGQDLNSVLGEDFFSVPSTKVIASTNNIINSGISVTISDVSQLEPSDYELTYNGSNKFTLIRVTDGAVTNIDTGGAYPYTSPVIDGLTININAAPSDGDLFLLRTTSYAAQGIDIAITNAQKVAAAVPIRTNTSLNNTGVAAIDSGKVTDRASFESDTYTIHMVDATAAIGGAIGFTDDLTNPDTLQYELRINNFLVNTYNEGDSRTLAQLASDINADVANTGVRAYVNAAGTTLYFANDPATALPITVTETLTGASDGDNDQLTGIFGSLLTGTTTPSVTINFSQPANDYIVIDSGNNVEASGTYTSGDNITFNGIQVSIKDTANLGDKFTVLPNTDGVSDNRNALSLAALQTNRNLDNGNSTYQSAYGKMVATVGIQTRQAEITRNANEALLFQAEEAHSSLSGVNLDEEAANMIKFQQAYQAMAQIISTTDLIFQTLINAVGR
ncbi:MAG: flagellar hook-associated protein FlgK [Gammaproteobacteria bacterium]|nr:flagellar hook-associated protein FlgK [Gammaproteobacteria bacterium]